MIDVYSHKFLKLYDSTLSFQEFKRRAKKLYPKLGITNFMQMSGIMGYSPGRQMNSFYGTGVSSQAQVILRLLEVMPPQILTDLINNGE